MAGPNGAGELSWLKRPMFNGSPDPWWVRILERLGLPTFLLLVLLWGGFQLYTDAKAEWSSQSEKVVEQIGVFATEQRVTNEKLDDLIDEHRRPRR